MKWLAKVRAVLGKITDILIAGRNLGWWQEKDEPWKKK